MSSDLKANCHFFATGCRKSYLSSEGCRKPIVVGKHCSNLNNVFQLLDFGIYVLDFHQTCFVEKLFGNNTTVLLFLSSVRAPHCQLPSLTVTQF